MDIDRLEASTSQIPPYLFRAFARQGSRGINNENEMRPIEERTVPRRSIFARPPAEIKAMLRSHLLWMYDVKSDFISWSSSILWTLEHAARMYTYERWRKSDVHIAVMDTRKIHDMAIFPATALMEIHGLPGPNDPNRSKLLRSDYTSEYLFYGPLRNNAADPYYEAVRWEEICAADLHELLANFSGRPSNDHRLLLRINELRAEFEARNSTHELQRIVPLVVHVGALFGTELQVVVAIALTTLLCGGREPDAAELRQILKNLRMPRPRDYESIAQYDFASHVDAGLTEVMRMYQTLKSMVELSLAAQQQDLTGTMGNLNIGR